MKGDSFNNARMKLLMETVFLKKFGSTRINYQAEKYFLTMGNLPLAAISLPVKGESEDIVLVSNDRQEKSAFSIKPVADKVFNKLEGVKLGTLEEFQETENAGEASGTDTVIETTDQKIGIDQQEDKRSEVLKVLKDSASCFTLIWARYVGGA
ncbi:hypothetical protein OUZ56_030068 [Daphnia magna]|uniref:Uncharacterized protein n=1 Tax=Daphnia magna TaxID=35525 RepID=A0ABQ9ZQ76_9CRUS|nr:hypothetical protein OUZ56_030068 [Daphnia magna]